MSERQRKRLSGGDPGGERRLRLPGICGMGPGGPDLLTRDEWDQRARYLGVMIKIISEEMRRHGDAEMKKVGLTYTQMVVLQILRLSGGSAPQKVIERQLHVTHPTVTGIIARLERKELVTSAADENDRRSKVVRLRDEGKRLAEQSAAARDDGERIMTKGMSDEEVRELHRLLAMVLRNMMEKEQEECQRY